MLDGLIKEARLGGRASFFSADCAGRGRRKQSARASCRGCRAAAERKEGARLRARGWNPGILRACLPAVAPAQAGARGGTRTRTPFQARDFKSRLSTNFSTRASGRESSLSGDRMASLGLRFGRAFFGIASLQLRGECATDSTVADRGQTGLFRSGVWRSLRSERDPAERENYFFALAFAFSAGVMMTGQEARMSTPWVVLPTSRS